MQPTTTAQLAVIQSIYKHKRPLAVGLEIFQHIEQSILDGLDRWGVE